MAHGGPSSGLTTQRIRCHACGHSHDCADNAENTQCPHCGHKITFSDIVISSHVSRKIDTRGDLRIERRGNLFTPLTICHNAVILGMISGSIRCEGKITFLGSGSYPIKIETNELMVPGGAEVFCPFPIHAQHAVIRGTLHAPLLVEHRLEVLRKGHVEGAICARSIHVDRGGELRGQVRISPGPIPLPSNTKETTFPSLRPMGGSRFRKHRPSYLGPKL
jgi:cytoskeletal protein CcmA (bactofilin family)